MTLMDLNNIYRRYFTDYNITSTELLKIPRVVDVISSTNRGIFSCKITFAWKDILVVRIKDRDSFLLLNISWTKSTSSDIYKLVWVAVLESPAQCSVLNR
ncbi:hypothetical protein ACOME3_009324 [Neoechinorhynchus agilis]